MNNSITFCINTAKNEKAYVCLLLKSLIDHTSIDDHEVLIFIDSDNQNTYEELLKYKKTIKNLKIHRNTTGFPVGSQTNVSVMFNAASNEIVCYLQSDMVVGKDFDRHIIENISEKTVLSCARIEPPVHPESPEKIVQDFGITPEAFDYDRFNSFVDQLQKENRPNMDGHFAPFAIHKKTWFDCMGGFDVQFRCSREDSDTIIRMTAAGLETVQSWNACVYHFTCVSSRGDKWYEQSKDAEKKNYLQQKADQEELRRFIRKWGYFGHHYKPRYDLTLVLDMDTGAELHVIKQIEPYFSRVVINDLEVVKELERQLEHESHYYANKRWNYSHEHWNQVKHTFRPVDFNTRIVYEPDLNSVKGDVVVRTGMLDLIKMGQDRESYDFIMNSGTILSELLEGGRVQVGTYEVGVFKVRVLNLKDVNEGNKRPEQYLIQNVEKYSFM